MTLLALSSTAASSSLRRWFRSSRNSRCLRWKSWSSCDKSRCLAARSAGAMVAPFLSIASDMVFRRAAMSCNALSRFENSCSSFVCAALAAADSRKMRSELTAAIRVSCASALAAPIRPSVTDITSANATCFESLPVRKVFLTLLIYTTDLSCSIKSLNKATASGGPVPRQKRKTGPPTHPDRGLERRTDLELELLILVAGMFRHRETQAQLERADWRDPGQTETVTIPQAVRTRAGAALTRIAPDVTAVEEGEDAQRAVITRTRQREGQLDVTHCHARTADRVARGRVTRTQRARFITANRADTAGIVVLENRVCLALQALTVAALQVQAEHEATRERVVILRLGVNLDVRRVTRRRTVFRVRLRVITAARDQCAVTIVTRPADRHRHVVHYAAEFLHVVDIALRRGGIDIERVLLEARAEVHRVLLRERNAELQVTTDGNDLEAGVRGVIERLIRAVVQVGNALDAVDGEVRIDLRNRQRPVRLGRVDIDREAGTRTEHVVLRHAGRQHHLVRRRKTRAERNRAGRLFRDLHVHVHLVVRAFNRNRGHVDVGKVTETIHTILRQRQPARIEP